MLIEGQVTCFHCGRTAGRWVGKAGTPLLYAGLRAGVPENADAEALIRCDRCSGPVFLDEATAVVNSSRLRRIRRLRAQLAEYGPVERRRAA